MTKVVKWWKKFGFWSQIRMFLGLLGIGSEFTLFIVDSYPHWKIIAGAATLLSLSITLFFKDEDGNGIVDGLEKK